MLFLLFGLVIGVGTVVTLFTITDEMEFQIGDTFDQIGANIIITPKSNNLSLSYGGVPVSGVGSDINEIKYEDIEKIWTIENAEVIATVSPKLLGSLEVEGEKNLILGVEFEEELRMKSWWRINTDESPVEPINRTFELEVEENEVILGFGAANRFDKKPGDVLEVEGEQYKVVGVIQEMGAEEDAAVLMSLPLVQKMMGKPGMLNLVEVSALCNTCPIEDVVAQTSDVLPGAKVTAIKEAVEARERVVGQFSNFALATSAVVLLIGTVIVAITMISSVSERTKEIGIFRAIGFRKGHVAMIILTEAAIVSLIGGVIGYVGGMMAASISAPFIAQMDLNIAWDLMVGIQAIGLSLVVGLLSSIIPMIQAAKLDPNDALRYI